MKYFFKFYSIFLVLPLALMLSCNTGSSEESTEEVAEEVNEAVFEWEAEEDAEFITTAYSFNLMLQEYGELAQQKATIPLSVMEFAQTSTEYHSNLNNQLSSMAQNSGVALPVNVGDNVQDYMADLREKEGAEFAEAYVDVVSDIQDKMIDEYQDAVDNAYDPELRAWAATELQMMQQREEFVDELDEVTDELE